MNIKSIERNVKQFQLLLGCYVLVRDLNDLIIQHTFLHNRFNQTVLTIQWK